ncbi:hypothetical protein FOZ62_019705 [Perkinsus olseni]|uniref:Uncharacterized protein n=1 Tax=Perkinsus olseni TaxID=32597 RepID=A0A7J6RBG5_PEROL|nr:hypothetical protein FOZ62_019705 [Perkinsus olseni]
MGVSGRSRNNFNYWFYEWAEGEKRKSLDRGQKILAERSFSMIRCFSDGCRVLCSWKEVILANVTINCSIWELKLR